MRSEAPELHDLADEGHQAARGDTLDLRSLPEVYRSVTVTDQGRSRSWWRRLLAFAGPGFLVSVGYMDPGNWGTDLAGGSRHGYALLWVVLVSNLMAIFLQTLCARLGIATGKDLAQACRDYYPKPVSFALWVLCEIAIIACDLAEVIGSAVALQLLLGLPLPAGVLVTGLDVLLLLSLMRFGFRKIEAIIVTLVATIGLCFLYNVAIATPHWSGVLRGTFVPTLPGDDSLFLSLGILGATVMPHNLYLHSAAVQTRRHGLDEAGRRAAIRFNTIDTVVALGAAFFVNAAILILAASVFHEAGIDVEELAQAHELLRPALGGAAATAFAVALLCSGQSSTITGTLAGQVVMEGFLRIRVRPWLRRFITRGLAIIPALACVIATGGRETVQLLVVSQVVLSMQLPFAIFPLLFFTSSREKMGPFVNATWVKAVGGVVCTLITGLNLLLLWNSIGPVWFLLIVGAIIAFAAWVRFLYRPAAESAACPPANPGA